MANSWKLFGFSIVRQEEDDDKQPETPVQPVYEDGAINVQSGAHYGIFVDLDGTYRSEVDLLSKYRTMSMQPEMESAIEDICNESIVTDEHGHVVELVLDELEQPDNIKKMIRAEFDNVLRMLNFDNGGFDIFRRWYIDGRLYYNVVIDNDNPRDGIQSLVAIDPRRIRKIRNIVKKKNAEGVDVIDRIDTFYLYNEKVVNNNIQSPQIVGNYAGGVKLSEDSVVYITSGLFDPAKSTVLSYLHKAIRPMNQLRFIEDAVVIYTVSRAPERRVFYIGMGNIPRAKQEQYLKDMMTKYRNKLTYDASTGEIRDDRKHLSMLEDFWMPRQGGETSKTTEITTLPAGQGLTQNDIIKYFEMKLYRSLSVPVSRLEPQEGFSLGRSTEISRDEIKFDKFINKLRNRFAQLFDELMARQLTLKGVCTLEEWNEFKQDIHYKFNKDNHFEELKEAELLNNRLALLTVVQPFVGIYYSKKWVQENVLLLDEDEVEQMKEEMEEEQEEMEADQAKMAAMQGDQEDQVPADTVGATDNAEELNSRAEKQFGDTVQDKAASQKPKKPAEGKKTKPK